MGARHGNGRGLKEIFPIRIKTRDTRGMDDGESSRAERLVHLQLQVLAAGSPLGLTHAPQDQLNGPNDALSGVVICDYLNVVYWLFTTYSNA